MENDIGVRKLVEFIFVKKLKMGAEVTDQDCSVSTCLIRNDFPRKMHSVLSARCRIVAHKWFHEFDTFIHGASTYSKYLRRVMSACVDENACHQNVFDSFIAVCGLVKYFSRTTLEKTGVDFSVLNSHIVMEFYDSVLKKTFHRRGGFQRLVEYIHHHKYLTWNLDVVDLDSYGSSNRVNDDTTPKLMEEINSEEYTCKLFKHNVGILDVSSIRMARRILSKTSDNLPALPSDHDPKQNVGETTLNVKANTAEGKRGNEPALKFASLEEVRQRCLNSNPDSKTNHITNQKSDIQYENIIQAVRRCNRSKSSGLVNPDNSIKRKADSMFEHLKEKIESLIEILDEFDKK